MRALNINTFGDALIYGLVVGLGFLTNDGQYLLNLNIPRPLLYGVGSGSYFLAEQPVIEIAARLHHDRRTIRAPRLWSIP